MRSGEIVIVESVQHEILEASVTVYNFEVEGFHTYYVTRSSVLVHNSCKMSLNTLKDSYIKKTLKIDAHKIKYEYLGKKANIKLYDLAVNKGTGVIYIINKAGKIVAETYYRAK